MQSHHAAAASVSKIRECGTEITSVNLKVLLELILSWYKQKSNQFWKMCQNPTIKQQ